jgi:alkyl sulfatase BDS1-like metallo-beta-lactamase superfamily hydrolase
MKIQIVKKEEGKWEIEIDEQQLLDLITMMYEKLSEIKKDELEIIGNNEAINKLIERFLGGKEGEW